MIYLTVMQSPIYHQMTLDELLFGDGVPAGLVNNNTANTRTYETMFLSDKLKARVDVTGIIKKFEEFNNSVEELRKQDRHSLYREFPIPKRSGGVRIIDAPKPELMEALRRLKYILENDCGVLYHTSAFAYVKNRCAVDAVKRHQSNESKWFGKFDLSNFFGSTTHSFVMKMFSMIYPLSEVVKTERGKSELSKALDLAFLNGGLPQGTPISPLITNVMMIPIDFKLSGVFRNFNNQKFVYTRYADDFLISSRYTFDINKVQDAIEEVLSNFEAPFSINRKKTRYGSSSGRNWNLGVMLTADNRITVGHKKKRQMQAMLASYVMDRQNGNAWDKNDIQVMAGHLSYYKSVEGTEIDKMVEHVGNKFGVNIYELIKFDLQ